MKQYIPLIFCALIMLSSLAFGLYFDQMTTFLTVCIVIQLVCVVLSAINLRKMRKINNSTR